LIVPERGELEVALGPPAGAAAETLRYRAALTVVTPAGRGYLASWEVQVLAAPQLEATVFTPLGSTGVEISGLTAAHARVTVAGEPVTVAAVDPLGNEAGLLLTGIGIFDYRSLPWVPISGAVLGVAAVFLLLRVPRTRSVRTASEEGTVEELEPD
jgi:hypothetical protein